PSFSALVRLSERSDGLASSLKNAQHFRGPRRGGRAVECGGLENRFGPLGPTRVQIPPPPLFHSGEMSEPPRPSKPRPRYPDWSGEVSEWSEAPPSRRLLEGARAPPVLPLKPGRDTLTGPERCPSGLRSATGNRVRAERSVAGSNPVLSVPREGPLGGPLRYETLSLRSIPSCLWPGTEQKSS